MRQTMVLVYVMCVMVMESTVQRNVLSSEQKLAYSCLCCMDETLESSLMQL